MSRGRDGERVREAIPDGAADVVGVASADVGGALERTGNLERLKKKEGIFTLLSKYLEKVNMSSCLMHNIVRDV